jgi:hypothetical protein
MTTSDKKPRRTTKSARTAKTSGTADGSLVPGNAHTLDGSAAAARAAIPTLSEPVRTAKVKAVNVSVTSRHREDRHASICLAAYFIAESRGFAPGHEVEDWLAAEEMVDQRLIGEGRTS